jgi:hypothetical protein
MEKFGTWSDKKTGIRPFIPGRSRLSRPKLYLRYVFGWIKLVCAVISGIVGGIILPFWARLIPIRSVSRFFIRMIHFLYFNGLLVLLGHFFPKCVPTPLVNKIVEPEKWRMPKKGTIVIAPLTNFINLVYMTAVFSPVYAIPVDSKSFVTYTVLGLIWRVLHSRDLRDGEKKGLKEILAGADGPVVIFPEAAPTNGSGLLKFVAFEAEVPKETEVQLLGFIHEDDGVAFISGGWLRYLARVFGRFYSPFSAVTSLAGDLQQPAGKITAKYIEVVRGALGRLLRIPLLDLDANDYLACVESSRPGGKQHVD